jgi:hypothetical protein
LIAVNRAHPATQYLERYQDRPEIAEAIRDWATATRGKFTRPLLQNYMVLGRSMVPAIAEILVAAGGWTEAALLTLTESRFMAVPGFPIERNLDSPGNTASGPWQITDATARALHLRYFSLSNTNGPVNPCDDRADWKKSTAAIGRYFSLLLTMFRNDPLLAVLGYAMGPYGVEKEAVAAGKRAASRDQLAQISESGFSYWGVKRFHMAQIGAWHAYVMHFAAATLIARDPLAYKFALPEKGPLAPQPACHI